MVEPPLPPNGLPPVPDPGAPAEPLISVGGLTAGAVALLALLVSFGVDLSDEQTTAILAAVAVVAPLLVALIGRTKVFSPYTTGRMVRKARAGEL